MTDWDDHVEWILGDEVCGVEATTADRKTSFSAKWIQVLEYEYQLRKHAAYLVNTAGVSLAGALIKARNSETIHRKHLATPLSLTGPAEVVSQTVVRQPLQVRAAGPRSPRMRSRLL